MSRKAAKEAFLYDKRVLNRHVATKKISKEELEGHLKSLPDQEGNYEDIGAMIYGEEKNSDAKSE